MKSADRYLNWMANICREAYITERTTYEIRKDRRLAERRPPYVYKPGPRWDGGRNEDGVEYEAIWPKIAAFMIEHELEPIECIRKRFALAKGSNPPWPTQIAVVSYLDTYKGLTEVLAEEDVQIAFELDKKYCLTAYGSQRYNVGDKTPQTVWTAILLDMSLDVTPLMRYCLAKELGLDKVVKMLEDRALLQYMKSPSTYDKVWGKHIPPELASASSAILSSIRLKRSKKTDE